MIWIILIELFLLIMAILFLRFKKNHFSILAIGIMILLPSALLGVQVGGRLGLFLVPYFVFGYEEVQNNNIVCSDFKEGIYYFSNGEKSRDPNSRLLDAITSVGCILGGGIVFFPGFFLAKKITQKYAPEVYKLWRK